MTQRFKPMRSTKRPQYRLEYDVAVIALDAVNLELATLESGYTDLSRGSWRRAMAVLAGISFAEKVDHDEYKRLKARRRFLRRVRRLLTQEMLVLRSILG